MIDKENGEDPLDSLFTPLRQAEPPDSVRNSIKQATQAALQTPVMPWWRRKVALPIPVAYTAAAALVISLTFNFREETPNTSPSIATAADDVSPLDLLQYSETQSYLCGVGAIQRNIYLPPMEQFR